MLEKELNERAVAWLAVGQKLRRTGPADHAVGGAELIEAQSPKVTKARDASEVVGALR